MILHPTPVPAVAASFAAAPQPGSVAAAAAAPAGHLPWKVGIPWRCHDFDGNIIDLSNLENMLGLVFFQSIIVASNKLPIYIYIIYIYIYRPFRGGWIDYVESYVKNCEDIYYTIQFGGVIIFSNPHLYAYINFMCIYIYICVYVYICLESR